ncbi:helix-turn-helix transcriptional regulator (plasmid) [Deinococcus radiomollis]|uniref:helix-turn-helix domain-containing protein n=1 Tax=Deinococcus radiomollis TaxID=468916 RepID=UPI0038924A5C
MSVISIFRELRENSGMNLVSLAHLTGVSVALLSDLERGKGRAEDRVLTKLAEVYGVPVEALAEGCPVPAGLQELLARPGVRIPECHVLRLCRLEFRGGQSLSADDWARLSAQLVLDD